MSLSNCCFRYFITGISEHVCFIYWNVCVRMFSPQDNIDATWCIHYGTLFFLTRFISYNNFFISVTAVTLPLTVTSSSLAISFRSIIFVTFDLLNSLGLKFMSDTMSTVLQKSVTISIHSCCLLTEKLFIFTDLLLFY